MAIKLYDARALSGGIAFMMTGCVLSAMCGLYFYSAATDQNFLKSRVLWEIVLNLQVLSIALIWFAYDERIEGARGRWRVRMIVNLIFSVVVNLAPLGFFFYTTYRTWYSDFPNEEAIRGIIYGIVVGWLVFELLVQSGFRLVTGKVLLRNGGDPERSVRRFFANLWPVMLMVAVLTVSEIAANRHFYVIAPIFGYMKGGLDFFRRAYRPSRQEVAG